MPKKETIEDLNKKLYPNHLVVQWLSDHVTLCPHCHKEIVMPEVKLYPYTLEDLRKRSKALAEQNRKVGVKM